MNQAIKNLIREPVKAYLKEYESLHTGENCGFSWQRCDCCQNTDGGERLKFYGLLPTNNGEGGQHGRLSGFTAHDLGRCCATCFDTINE